jgi:hypothetical protein
MMQAALQRWLGDLIQVQNLTVTSEDSSLKINIRFSKRGSSQSSTIQIARTV